MADVCTSSSGNLVRVSPPSGRDGGGMMAKNKNANPTQITAEHLFRLIYNSEADPGFNYYSGARGNYYKGSPVPTKGFYGAEGLVNVLGQQARGERVKTQKQGMQEMGLPVQFGSNGPKKGRKQMAYADNRAVKKIASDSVASVAVPIQKKKKRAAAPVAGKPAVKQGTNSGGAPTSLVSWFLS